VSGTSLRALVLADADALAAVAAETIVRHAKAAVATRGRFLLALSGGTTPQSLYRLLAQADYDEVLPWSATVVLWGDERCVPPDDPASNYGSAARSGLLARPFSSVKRMRGELGAEQAARDYEERLRALDASRVPAIDLVLLGIGEDGHTASLLPESATLTEAGRLVVPTEPYGGVRRVTLTVPVLAAARRLLFLVAGAGKAAPVAEILGDPASRLPAAVVLRAARRVTMLLDGAAAGGAPEGVLVQDPPAAPPRAGVAPDPGVV
jgi:6-phosphogluconolactonase